MTFEPVSYHMRKSIVWTFARPARTHSHCYTFDVAGFRNASRFGLGSCQLRDLMGGLFLLYAINTDSE